MGVRARASEVAAANWGEAARLPNNRKRVGRRKLLVLVKGLFDEFVDEATGVKYYFNKRTGTCAHCSCLHVVPRNERCCARLVYVRTSAVVVL